MGDCYLFSKQLSTRTVNHLITQWRSEPWYEQSGSTKASFRVHWRILQNGLFYVWWCMSYCVL